MTKRPRRYTEDFRRQMIDLVRSGQTPEELSRESIPARRPYGTGSRRPVRRTVGVTTGPRVSGGNSVRPSRRFGDSRRKSTSSGKRRSGSLWRRDERIAADVRGAGWRVREIRSPGQSGHTWGVVGPTGSPDSQPGWNDWGRPRAVDHARRRAVDRALRRLRARWRGGSPLPRGDGPGHDPEERMRRREPGDRDLGKRLRGADPKLVREVTGFEP